MVGTKPMADNTSDQINNWLVKHAQQELAISGGVDDRRIKETDLGGFKQTNVGLDFNFKLRLFYSSHTVAVQVYHLNPK